MRKDILLIVSFIFTTAITSMACTNILVGKKASVDGSVFCSYNNDGYGGYGIVDILPGGTYGPGAKFALQRWQWSIPDTIPQARETYKVVGRINEHQVSICETTFDGRHELENPNGLINYPQLMELGLQRAKTARKAIKIMADLMDKYGYKSSGESFSVCDPNEAWIMEIIGKGPDEKGAVWAAIRIPDDCIAAHANQSRIDKIPFGDKENCMYAKDVVSFARKKGYFSGKDKDFSFCDAYCPIDFSGRRFCEARVWSIFTKIGDKELMEPYFSFITGESDKKMPLYIKPKKKVSLNDVMNAMRDHYEDTPLDLSKDESWGPYCSPYRPFPLTYKVDGETYHHERTIGTCQTIFSMVAQMRSWLPDEVGGIQWFGADDGNGVSYVPLYCNINRVPDCFDEKRSEGNTDKFSFKSAFWMCNWVSNMVYQRYNLMQPDLEFFRNRQDSIFQSRQSEIEEECIKLGTKEQRNEYLTAYTDRCASEMMETWMQLAQFLIVKYNDMKVLDSEGDHFVPGWGHNHNQPISEDFKRRAVEQTQGKYLMKKEKKTLHSDVVK